MKHKHLTFLLAMLMSMVVSVASAHDVEIDGIYYNLIPKAKQASVTFQGDNLNSYLNEYTGIVTIPESVIYNGTTYSVTSIGSCAFAGCSGLTSVTIPNSVTNIGDNALLACSGLTTITIPNSVTSIGESAFNESGLTSIDIPSSITSISVRAFKNCSALTSVTIGNGVTSIGDEAFSGCTSLTSITIPNSVTNIGKYAFNGCSGLTSITIPNSMTSIGDYAFYGCWGLTSITIPNSVTSIGQAAFMGCSDLTSVTIPSSVTSIGDEAFRACTGLTSVNIPNSVWRIGNYAFFYCTGLTSVNIPNSVSIIGSSAFRYCTGLTSLTIGNGVKNIYDNAFAQCENLEEVYCHAVNVPNTNSSAFSESMVEYATLYVPEESLEAYKAASPWSGFGTKKPLSGMTPETKKCGTPVINYADGKLTFTCETDGAQFVSEITDTDIKTYYDSEVNLSVTYTIKVYAILTGYDDSDVATATLCWIEQEPQKEGIEETEDFIHSVASQPVLIQSNGGVLSIEGATEGAEICVYTLSGQKVGAARANARTTNVRTSLLKHDVAIVKIGDKAVKIVVQ